jgi:nucleoside-diphosphate-sugar epimerase
LLPVPVSILKLGATLLGKQTIARRLCESLQVDTAKARDVLGWRPPISVEAGLQRTVDWYLETSQ